MFQPAHIQLPTEEQPLNTTAPPPPAFIKRSSSNWSIPCCSNFSIRGQRIQLPDDSDEEEQQEEFIINNTHLNPSPTINPFTMNSESANGNSFIPHATQLSRNPFARVTATEEEEDRPASKKSIVPEATNETLPIETELAENSNQKNLGGQVKREKILKGKKHTC